LNQLVVRDDQEKSKTLLALGQRQLKQLNATGSLLGGDSEKFRGTRPTST
jgi:hypothetical protein